MNVHDGCFTFNHFVCVLSQVVGSSGEIVSFKINKHTPMGRALDEYAKKTGQERHTIRFRWAGVWISNTDTPGTLNMKNNEIVNAINQYVERPSQSDSSSNSITTPSMDSPRSRDPSPSSLDLKREEEKEKRAVEEQKDAEEKARNLAEEKARTVAAKQASSIWGTLYIKATEDDQSPTHPEIVGVKRKRSESSVNSTVQDMELDKNYDELADEDNMINTEQRLAVIESKMGRVVDQQQEILNLLSNTYKKLKKVRSHGGALE
ncbi:hypothetical protein C8J55DRAFT_499001 [Lentinula edodes]|uniref:Rad60/SUMO-like domain-containing protein n=1 Tax=Lentinula lateritia TaxID=40482 RepID=A0A9W9B082_9AGAR|nr:hypothetical protein C8J55DRAFT_499001 [Lentinula edodes]